MTQYVLDSLYLGITVIVAFAFQIVGFITAFSLQTDIIQDGWSALTFALLAVLTFGMGATFYARQIVVLVFVLLWAIRLGGFQVFRIAKMGGDARFDDMRGKFASLATFWFFQWLWTWIVSLPVIVLNSPAISVYGDDGGGNVPFGTSKDIVGIILWVIGFCTEASADFLKYYWKMGGHKHPKGAIIDLGPWAWCRRPNYFGEILVWLGIYLIAISPATDRPTPLTESSQHALLATVVSPIFTFLILMFLSGVPTAEKPTQQRAFLASHGPDAEEQDPLPPYHNQRESDPWLRYKTFRERTSLLIPIPTAIYSRIPRVIKRTILFDWGLYRFDEAKDGPKAIKEAKDKKERNSA
ncbi:hypothetical protein OC846_000153 [Tilletia horrida]|uniref:Steroid 5-alpha reductase C-terminal domain-containing protein n=1 Tax=Tilletia horrida TaxID=155126 RepID=A0AAN6GYB2_9BASI|nr:hypothetical protein OC846_000153 [Tilletia horrida]KAK0570097.1 hypothetical protein OC861_000239 [Tilletia horrida]